MSCLGRPPEYALLVIASIRTSAHDGVARAYEKGSDVFVGTFRPPCAFFNPLGLNESSVWEVTAE